MSKSLIGSVGIAVLFTNKERGSFKSERGIIRPDDIRFIASRVIKNALRSKVRIHPKTLMKIEVLRGISMKIVLRRKNTRN
jgi:hypothetical protein